MEYKTLEQVDNNLNIVLVGMPGAGKSFIGKKLAKLLVQFSYIDTDAEIQNTAGMTITEIFEKHSEKYFRELESNLIYEISNHKNCIISIGGGAFENEENRRLLKKNSLVFYLKAPVDELYQRIENETHRPLLDNENPKQKLKTTLKRREKNFLKANFVINTYKQPAYSILDKIIGAYESYVRPQSIR